MSPLKTGQNQHPHLLQITRWPSLGGEEVLRNPLHRHESGFVPIHWIPHSWNKEIVTKTHRFNLMNCNPPWKRETNTSNCRNWEVLHHCIRTIEGFNKTTHCFEGVIQHGAVTPWRNYVEGGWCHVVSVHHVDLDVTIGHIHIHFIWFSTFQIRSANHLDLDPQTPNLLKFKFLKTTESHSILVTPINQDTGHQRGFGWWCRLGRRGLNQRCQEWRCGDGGNGAFGCWEWNSTCRQRPTSSLAQN